MIDDILPLSSVFVYKIRMASTISYAKIVRNQKDDDNIAPQEETNLKEQVPVSKDSSIKSKLLEKVNGMCSGLTALRLHSLLL